MFHRDAIERDRPRLSTLCETFTTDNLEPVMHLVLYSSLIYPGHTGVASLTKPSAQNEVAFDQPLSRPTRRLGRSWAMKRVAGIEFRVVVRGITSSRPSPTNPRPEKLNSHGVVATDRRKLFRQD